MTRDASNLLTRLLTLRNAIFVFASIQTVWLIWYFWTGSGGPQELVAHVMSVALILQILFMYQDGDLYKFLPRAANNIIVTIYVAICVYAFIHFHREFEEIAIWRQGSYTTQDYVVG